MRSSKNHSDAEIAAKLAQANDLAAQGKLQSEIAKTLGVSVMTLHRWRKLPVKGSGESKTPAQQELSDSQRIADIQLENARLRRLVTDLLLEKMKLEETVQGSLRRAVLPSGEPRKYWRGRRSSCRCRLAAQ